MEEKKHKHYNWEQDLVPDWYWRKPPELPDPQDFQVPIHGYSTLYIYKDSIGFWNLNKKPC